MTAVPLTVDAPVVPVESPLRLAVFSIGLPCPGQKRGGIEQVAHDLSNALVARGHEVTVFTYDPAPEDARYLTQVLPGSAFVTSWLGRRLTMGYLANIFAVMPGYRAFDAVIAHGDSLLLPLTGRPVVRVMHGSAFEEARTATSLGRAVLQLGVYVQELLTALTQRGTVAISENTRRFNPFIHRVIPDGIDLTLFRPMPGAKRSKPTLIFVGALRGRKRGDWLLSEFQNRIRPSFPDAELHMVTSPGPAIDGVAYHTGIDRAELAQLFRQAWLYVSPSTYEGFGLPYVEALACGTAVVATPNPGSREVLRDGTFGSLPDDERFSSEICRLLADDAARARLVRAGLERAREYDITRSAERYESVLRELVHGRRPADRN